MSRRPGGTVSVLRHLLQSILLFAGLLPPLSTSAQSPVVVIGTTGGPLNANGPDGYRIFSRYLEDSIPG